MEQNIYFHNLPVSVKKFVNILMSQEFYAHASGNWKEVIVKWSQEDENGDINVRIPSSEIGFKFSNDGKFIGIWNYKE